MNVHFVSVLRERLYPLRSSEREFGLRVQSVATRMVKCTAASIMNPKSICNRNNVYEYELTDGPARTITLFDGDPADDVVLLPCAITLLHDTSTDAFDMFVLGAADVDAPAFISNTAAKELGSSVSVDSVVSAAIGTQSARDVLLFLANTAAVTDSMAAATLRGVTIICGRTAVAAAAEAMVVACCCS